MALVLIRYFLRDGDTEEFRGYPTVWSRSKAWTRDQRWKRWIFGKGYFSEVKLAGVQFRFIRL